MSFDHPYYFFTIAFWSHDMPESDPIAAMTALQHKCEETGRMFFFKARTSFDFDNYRVIGRFDAIEVL